MTTQALANLFWIAAIAVAVVVIWTTIEEAE